MDARVKREARLELLHHYGGHSLAYSTLQPGMRYWGDGSTGYGAYRKTLGQHTFLGDPVCAPAVMASFVRATVGTFPNALFMQIHEPAANVLRDLGHHVTPVGVENEIDTRTFSLTGKPMADLRHYRNKAQTSGVTVVEMNDTEAVRSRLRPVSDAWLPVKSWPPRELEFLARPYVGEPEPGVRIFGASIDGRIVGFVVLDPMFRAGAVTGYTVTILRHYPAAPEGCVDYIVLHVIDVLAGEGIPLLSLGVSPFHRIAELGQTHGYGSWPVYGLYRALWRWGNPIYHFRGLSFHKSRYRAREIPVFTAVPGPFGLLPLYASARACRML